jgi:predicted dehydrogenase
MQLKQSEQKKKISMGMNKDIKKHKVAIVGAGNMAEEHIKAYNSLNNLYRVTGIFSRTLKKASHLQKKYKIENLCSSINELQKKSKAEILIISTNVLSTKKILFKALKYNWKILVEKPAGYNLKEAKKIYETAKKKNKLNDIFVGLNRRNFQSTRKLLSILKNGKNNRILTVTDYQNINNKLIKKHPILVQKNWMYANSIHLVDYFSIFCRGRIISVKKKIKLKSKKLEYVHASLSYSSGDQGVYKGYWMTDGKWKISLREKNKIYKFQPLERLKSKNNSNNFLTVKTDYSLDTKFKPGVLQQAKEISSMLNKNFFNLATLKQSLTTMKLINKIYKI